jgi:hypothetical protein
VTSLDIPETTGLVVPAPDGGGDDDDDDDDEGRSKELVE